ncbi:MAG: LURP-one-related family protein [Clostridiales bacterium]|nr:LURP-one-related family protein [Clostridiales bacterium]
MKIIVKNKFVSWGGSSIVEDEAGNQLYQVKGKAFSWHKKKTLLDMNGNVLYRIRNKWPTFLLHSAYICDKDGNKLCKVKANLSFKHGYVIQETNEDIQVHGYILSGMQVSRNGVYIGTVTKEFWALRDYFVLDVLDGQDPTFLIALVIAIDNIQDKSQGQAS